jgi:predicted RNA-binding Zn ribbon-like protein
VFVGNSAAIDFVNTQIIQRGVLVDLLEDNNDFLRWVQEAGYRINDGLTLEDLAGVKVLRTALYDIFLAKINAKEISQDSLEVINQHLAAHQLHKLLQKNEASGELELVADTAGASLPALLAEIALEAANLLTSTQANHIKRCSNPDCVILFLDTSRTKKRRWCSMDICGNRAKVAKHYQKQLR